MVEICRQLFAVVTISCLNSAPKERRTPSHGGRQTLPTTLQDKPKKEPTDFSPAKKCTRWSGISLKNPLHKHDHRFDGLCKEGIVNHCEWR